jgi:type II secretory pathway predicted ATPase ExeA
VEHLHHFGLSQDPFSNEPDLRFYFETDSHRDGQRRVERGLRQRKGLTLLTGDGGMGKTLLTRRILEALEEEVFEATLLVMLPGAADATGILQRFARQLGCEQPAADRAGLLGQVYEHLAIVREDGRHAVLMVDDAQVMTAEVLAELSGLLNLEYEDRRLVSMLFVGSPELDRMVQDDASIMPRVDVRVRLQPLDLANATAYLTHRLSAVNGNPEILPPAAIDALFKFGRGRPRLLNTLADNALFEAYLAGRPVMDPSDVERAAADLGIGSDPGTTFSQPSAAAPPAMPIAQPTVAEVAPSSPSSVPSASLDEVDPVADFELTPDMESPVTGSAAIDLEADLEVALGDFGEPDAALTVAPGPTLEALDFNVEASSESAIAPMEASLELASPVEEPLPALEIEPEPEFVLAEAELSPLGVGEADELEDAFVELIEE